MMNEHATCYVFLLLFASVFVADGIIDLGGGNYEGQMILVGGEDDSMGNVLVYHMSEWGFVCDDYWNIWAGLVVCRHLGFRGVVRATRKGYFKRVESLQNERRIWMDNVECKGNEKHITDCRWPGWGRHNCDATEAAGVVCKKDLQSTKAPIMTVPPDIQNDAPHSRTPLKYKILGLIGGPSKDDGFVQVEVKGVKGTICADNWTLMEARVVCKQLGKYHAGRAYKDEAFGGVDEKKVLGGIECEGHEAKLSECLNRRILEDVECPAKNLVAGVSCTKLLPDLVPEAHLIQSTTYIEDRPIFYMQCAMEEGCASRSAYTIMRTSNNWHLNRRRLLRFSSNIFNNGTADFRPFIPKHQWEWHSCHMHYHSMEVFATYDLVDHLGNKLAEGHKASFCLEDSGGCRNGHKKKYNCESYGDQGISIGCADLYKHTIDCQWIDVTDVSPGRYKLRVHVNPENKVAELNYDNNAVACDLYYRDTYATATNCKNIDPKTL